MSFLLGNIPLQICLAYLFVSLLIGVLPGLKKIDSNTKSFVAADGSMGTTLLFFVMGASIFSSLAYLGIPSMAYSRGAAAYSLLAAGILGAVPFFFLGPAVRKIGESRGFITQGDFFSWRYNSPLMAIIFSVIALIVSVPYLVFQIKGAGLVLEILSGGRVPFWLGASLTYGVVGTYVLISGVRGVGWTNAVQGVFMAAVALFLGWYFPYVQHGGIGAMFTDIAQSDKAPILWGSGLAPGAETKWGSAGFSSTVIVVAAGFTCWPHLFIKCFAAKSQRSLRRMATLYPLYILLLVPLILVGYSAVLQSVAVGSPDALVPGLLVDSKLPVLVVGALAAAILAASMSSGDTILHAAGSIVVHDGLETVGLVPANKEMLFIRWVIVLVLGFSFAMALTTNKSIVQLYLASYAFVAQILPATVAAVYWRRSSKAGVLAGLVVGVLVSCLLLVFPDLKPIPLHEGFYGLICNIVVLILVSLSGKKCLS